MGNSVGKRLDVNMFIHPKLLNAFKPAEIDKEFIQPLYKGIAKFIVGRNEGATPMSSPLGRHFTKSNRERYGFAPLSLKYAAWKRKKVGNKPMLVFTGLWKKAAVYGSKIKRLGKKGYSIQASNPPHYAEYLESGTFKMPARPAFTLNQEDREAVIKHGQEIARDLAGELMDITLGATQKVV